MSIYIKGLDLPEFPIVVIVQPDGQVESIQFFELRTKKVVGKAMPVPEHGRLIEAGAIKNGIANCIYDDAFARGWNAAMKRILEAVEDAPTIIPASEVSDG